MKHPFILLLIGVLALISGCDRSAPGEGYFDREGPPKRSDTLVEVMVRMVERIQDEPTTGDRDVDLTHELIEHHTATIAMNNIILADEDSIRAEVRAFAQRLSDTQEKEIDEMDRFLDSHPPVSEMGGRGVPDVMKGLDTMEPTDDLEAAYIHLMRMHLQDGIAVAEQLKERAQHDESREFATKQIQTSGNALKELEALAGGH